MREFMEYVSRELDEDRYDISIKERLDSLLMEMSRFVGEGRTKVIYAKNVFISRTAIKVYVFLEDFIIIGSITDYNKLVEIIKIRDIEKIEYQLDNETQDAVLRLTMYNGDMITLNNNLDTDREHSDQLKEHIGNIVKFLLKMEL